MERDTIYASIWARLRAATSNATDALRVGVLATHSVDGPQARSVVLRACSADVPSLRIYSDLRASKIEQLRMDPRASLLLYADGLQLRFQVRARVLTDGPVAEESWARCSLSARRAYMASAAPGSRLEVAGSGLPPGLDTQSPGPEQSETGRSNFAVIELAITRIDYLLLDPSGHRRIEFEIDARGEQHSNWCVP